MMLRNAGRALAFLFCGLAAAGCASDRPADQIVREIESIKRPTTRDEFERGNAKQVELIGELKESYPTDARLTNLLPRRWAALAQLGKFDEAAKDADETLARSKDESIRAEALFAKTQIALMKHAGDFAASGPEIRAFIKAVPTDGRVAMLEGSLNDALKQKERVGKPFELSFTEAIKGAPISMKDLKGKVVVVDFWATWCGPCIAEMPRMKSLYAEYKDKGVEFIGVSLDKPKEQGGLDKLKKFVADNQITWPQYYQGNYFDSEFSKGWWINSIPAVFVVDQDGNLRSVKAASRLKEIISELLAKGGKPDAGAGGQ